MPKIFVFGSRMPNTTVHQRGEKTMQFLTQINAYMIFLQCIKYIHKRVMLV